MDVIRLPSKAARRAVTRVWAHPDGRRLVALTGADLSVATLTWWDVYAGRRLGSARLPRHSREATFAPDHAWLVAGRAAWSPDSWVRVELSQPCRAWAFSPDGTALLGSAYRDVFSAYQSGTLHGPRAVDRWAVTADGVTARPPVLLDFGGRPEDPVELAVAPDGRGLFVLTNDGNLARFDLPDGGRPTRWQRVGNGMGLGLAVSPDGATLALAGPTGTFLFDGEQAGPLRAVLRGRGRQPFAFTPDSRRVVTASEDGTAAVWDAADGRLVARYDWHPTAGALCSVAVAPDGLTAYAGGTDGRVVRWDLPD